MIEEKSATRDNISAKITFDDTVISNVELLDVSVMYLPVDPILEEILLYAGFARWQWIEETICLRAVSAASQ